ncbi:hypothetical protein G1H11_07360 [Phytoactinopolyspora alkaliphila]|uniref:Uncharacterized protein n=1 Tax=Phytoactinopolyspora alkaliphila TaxID=1783498 RepID=A0A6N9YJN2_9ACTN|nr:hypothetical protein [Phytoactinopolyspora alkaliphila]NED95130.1 hypothetical protein [Phytoactinopolyspora alkaliphila]
MKRHDTDIMSLVFGLFFLGVFGIWALLKHDVMGVAALEVAAPLLLVTVGLAGLTASIGKIRRGRDG